MSRNPDEHRVQLADGTVWTVSNLRTEAGQARLRLIKKRLATGCPVAVCTCNEEDVAEFTAPNADVLYLRTFPRQLHRHTDDCFYAPRIGNNHDGGGGAGRVINERDGLFHVRLAGGVGIRDHVAPNPGVVPPAPHAGRQRARQQPISLYHLFDHIWEHAEMNLWHPGFASKRNANVVAHHALQQFARFAYNRTGTTLRHLTSVVFHPGQATGLMDMWQHAREEKIRPLLLTILRRVVPDVKPRAGWRNIYLPAPCLRDSGVPVQIDFELYNRLVKQFPVGSDVDCRRVGFLQLEAKQSQSGSYRYFEVVDGSFRVLSDQYIPVDSGHELTLTQKLVDEQRHFRKPLIVSPFEYLPDFILLDTARSSLPMEVFGMDHAEYVEHREVKSRYYDNLLGHDGWWSWSPLSSPTIPALPPPRRTS